ncbi:MAG: hypothetical protein J5542_00535 [Bacteroidales bacterium]|nr:hypothetical protein [Bacteroidales bacterium]
METKEHNNQWSLIHTDNGEWISDEYAVFVSQSVATQLKAIAEQQGKDLNIQHWTDGKLWCYRHELEAIDLTNTGKENVKFKIKTMAQENYKHYHCENVCKSDKPFKRAARSKQSWFREEYLKAGFDPSNKYGQYGAFLLPEDANLGFNFYEGFRSEILSAINKRYPKLSTEDHDGLYANMLRSEHIPWNIFIPMQTDLQATAKVFNDIIGESIIDEITDIRIEWAPEKTQCLNDRTSFDTYVEFKHKGKLGGIGIEIKYTEEGYRMGKTERHEVMENDQSRYAIVTRNCGLFKQDIANKPIRDTKLCKDEFRQIWRNHILGESMVMNHMLDRFYSITLYPSGNPHFTDYLPKYKEFLTEYGISTFKFITYEWLIERLKVHFSNNTKAQAWIEYLQTRYPF